MEKVNKKRKHKTLLDLTDTQRNLMQNHKELAFYLIGLVFKN